MIKRILCIVSFVVLAAAGPVFSQCADPDNMLSPDYCGFDTPASVDVATGWWNMEPQIPGDPLWGTVVHSASGGRTSPGSMAGTSFDNGPPPMGWGPLLGVRYCFPAAVMTGESVGYGGWINVTTGSVSFCEVVLHTSNAPDCSSPIEQVVTTDSPAAGWTKLNSADMMLTATADATHVEFRVGCYGMSDFTASYDDMFVGLGMVPVELQSFSIE